MRIRSQSLNNLVGVLGACLVRGWLGTVRFRLHWTLPEVDTIHPQHTGRYIYAFWHECILAMVGVRKPHRMSVLISRHQDGEYITQVVRRLGVSVVRGSTTRGGRSAVRRMLQAADDNHLLITPDGPRGPRRRLQAGAVFLAAHTGLPIVPVCFGFTQAWRANSWDRFVVPMPYSIVTGVAGFPISVPRNLDDPGAPGLEAWRARVECEMLRYTETAEAWALRLVQPEDQRRAA
ncbi:MAG: lysophospholipid acyltransferase family protein [Planctomycetes bacterium]|nr:lysophospholipid acyltransferase family protein [Planctomycetota bacterium]